MPLAAKAVGENGGSQAGDLAPGVINEVETQGAHTGGLPLRTAITPILAPAVRRVLPQVMKRPDRAVKCAGFTCGRLHRCGGVVKCTSCRVEVLEGDPGPQAEAERNKLTEKGFSPDQFRLSCQIRVTGDLKVRPAMTTASSGLEPGPRPAE